MSVMLGVQLEFGEAPAAPPPPAAAIAPPSFMVFFDWDRSNLGQQVLNRIKQAASTFKGQGPRKHHGDWPDRHVGSGGLQNGLVADGCQRGQGRAGA